MADLYVQLPADSTGKRMHTRLATSQGVQAHQEYQVSSDAPTYHVWTGTQTYTNGKYLLALTNTSSAQVVKVRKLFFINGQVTAATGIMGNINVVRIGTSTGGTAVVSTATDTNDGDLANVTIVSSPTTVQKWGTLFPWFLTNDEIGATGGFPTAMLQQLGNTLYEGPDIRPFTLRTNQGLGVIWATLNTVGNLGVLAILTVEQT